MNENLSNHFNPTAVNVYQTGREGRNRTCHRQFYLPNTGFEDQAKHQFLPL